MSSSNSLPTSQVAAQYTAPDPFHSYLNQTASVPKLPSSGIATLVRVNYASLNPVDYKLGSLPSPLPRLMVGASPITPASDFVGRVWSTTHPGLKAGDLVWGSLPQPVHQGACAQYTVVKGTTNISKIPEGWSRSLDELGVVGVAGFTALQVLLEADLPYVRSKGQETGGKVFINGGSGGVGTFMVQIAKHGMGCDTVIASCSAANAELVKSLGADHVIDYRSTNVADGLKQWAQASGGQKLDVLIDCVANDHNLYWESPHYLKPNGGRYLQVGGGFDPKSIISLLKVMAWPTFLGGGKIPFKFCFLGPIKQDSFDLLGRWMAEGRVKSVIEDDNRFELIEVGKAFQKLKSGRTRGKMLIEVAKEGQ